MHKLRHLQRQAFTRGGRHDGRSHHMAYTLVDVDSPVPEAAIKELCAIKGVLAVRYLPVEPWVLRAASLQTLSPRCRDAWRPLSLDKNQGAEG